MPREINDNGTTWTLAQAYAGLSENSEEASAAAAAIAPDAAAQVEGAKDLVNVVATPSGGAQTVRLHLKTDWEKSLSDEEILKEIKAEQKE